jgi:O-antigen/teichoic acid export membrane protein
MTRRLDVARSTLWSLIWYGSKTSFRFVSNMILTRLLSPEMFGIAAIGNAILNGIGMFSDIGLTQSVTHSRRNDASFFQTAWTMQLLRGVVLMLVVLILALPIGWLYDSPAVTSFLLIVAFSQLAMGLNNIEVLRDYRNAELRRVALIDITAAIVGLGIMIAWAFVQPDHIALALGALCSTATFTLLTLLWYPREMCRLRLEREAAGEIMHLGKWIFISTILAFFIMQMDRLALGKLVPLEWVGFYSIAWIWASIPAMMLGQWSTQVFFPLVTQVIAQGRDLMSVRKTRRAYGVLTVLASCLMFGASELLVAVLYRENYAPVAGLIRPLVAVALITAMEQSYTDLLNSFGMPNEKILGQLISVFLFAALLWPVFSMAGIEGVVYLLAACGAIRIVWCAWRLHPRMKHDLGFDAALLVGYVVCAEAVFALNQLALNRWVQGSLVAVQTVVVAAAAFALYRGVKRNLGAQEHVQPAVAAAG